MTPEEKAKIRAEIIMSLKEGYKPKVTMTAVEWLIEQIRNEKYIEDIDFEQAKEMEKQQIIDAYETSHISMMTSEQYYNEKYKLDTIDTLKLKK